MLAVYLPLEAAVGSAAVAEEGLAAVLAAFLSSPPMCSAASSAAVAEVEPAGTVAVPVVAAEAGVDRAAGAVEVGPARDPAFFAAAAPPLATAAYERRLLRPLVALVVGPDGPLMGATTFVVEGPDAPDTKWI